MTSRLDLRHRTHGGLDPAPPGERGPRRRAVPRRAGRPTRPAACRWSGWHEDRHQARRPPDRAAAPQPDGRRPRPRRGARPATAGRPRGRPPRVAPAATANMPTTSARVGRSPTVAGRSAVRAAVERADDLHPGPGHDGHRRDHHGAPSSATPPRPRAPPPGRRHGRATHRRTTRGPSRAPPRVETVEQPGRGRERAGRKRSTAAAAGTARQATAAPATVRRRPTRRAARTAPRARRPPAASRDDGDGSSPRAAATTPRPGRADRGRSAAGPAEGRLSPASRSPGPGRRRRRRRARPTLGVHRRDARDGPGPPPPDGPPRPPRPRRQLAPAASACCSTRSGLTQARPGPGRAERRVATVCSTWSSTKSSPPTEGLAVEHRAERTDLARLDPGRARRKPLRRRTFWPVRGSGCQLSSACSGSVVDRRGRRRHGVAQRAPTRSTHCWAAATASAATAQRVGAQVHDGGSGAPRRSRTRAVTDRG